MYKLERFGSFTLPFINASVPMQTGSVESAVVRLPSGGGYDSFGNEQSPMGPLQIIYSSRIVSNTVTNQAASYDALRALIGKRDRLYQRMPDGNVRWTYARLMAVNGSRRQQYPKLLDVELTFELALPIWNGIRHGPGWSFDIGYYFDNGLCFDEEGAYALADLIVDNDGNYAITSPVIEITAGGAAITTLEIALSGVWDLVYTGTINAGKKLVIDCGAYTVVNDGIDDLANLARGSGHAIAEWMELRPGSNSIDVIKTGGDANDEIVFYFSDGWA